jgi:hypothetical protein
LKIEHLKFWETNAEKTQGLPMLESETQLLLEQRVDVSLRWFGVEIRLRFISLDLFILLVPCNIGPISLSVLTSFLGSYRAISIN